jgi:tetratricopeptide (TPR) repeat protein
MLKQNRRPLNNLVLIALVAGVFSGSCFLPAISAPKPVDWDKELAKERHMMDTNNVEEAMAIISKYLKKHPEAAPLHTDMGKALKIRGKLSAAQGEFKRATEVDGNYADAWYELGSMYQSNNEFQLAVDSFEKYLSIAPYGDRASAVKDRISFCKQKL